MSRYRKILWDEGMLLTPHHFQQWDNYLEDQLNSRLASLSPYEWGALDLQVNRESIANGLFEIVRCSAVMPHGSIVSMPQTDPSPAARPIEQHFETAAERLDVYLSVPAKRVGAANFSHNGGGAGQMVRYVQDAGMVQDETT